MATVVFDTLILARKLAAAGMPTEQAQGVAAAIAETLGEQITTKRDLDDLRRDLITRIDQGEAKLTGRIDQVDGKIDKTEAKLLGRIEQVDGKIDRVEAKLLGRIEQIDGKIDRVEAKLTARIDQLELKLSAEIRQSEQRMTIRLGLMFAGGIGLVAALVKLL